MCHCGDYYCFLDDSRVANVRHSQLLKDEKWIKKYPDPVARDKAILHYLTAAYNGQVPPAWR